MPLLSCNHVGIRYDAGFVVKDVSFHVEAKDYLCIVGENGSGKSTLMKGILGLMKSTEGQISFEGIRKTEVGYLPQQTTAQKDFPASVFEVVLSGCLNRHGWIPFFTREDKERAFHNMKKLGVETLRKKSYRELSGGQQQRVLLARALCATEKLLMLDEPAAGLDPTSTMEMYELLNQINQENGVTVIMISHDIKSAMKYGNKILHMQKAPLFFGNTSEYKESKWGRKMLGTMDG